MPRIKYNSPSRIKRYRTSFFTPHVRYTKRITWNQLTRERLDQLNKETSVLGAKPKIQSMSEAGWDGTNSEAGEYELLTVKGRHPANPAEAKLSEGRQYDSRVAVFSREASKNFSKKFWEMVTGNSGYATKKSQKEFFSDPDQLEKLTKRQKVFKTSSEFEAQLDKLIEDKNTPHAIVVVEGPEEQENVSIKRKTIRSPHKKKEKKGSVEPLSVGYKRVAFSEGRTKKGASDTKQNFGVYVRKDMVQAYKADIVKIPCNGGEFPVVALDYETADREKYRSLVVHIPNKYAKGEKVKVTHKAFEEYAKQLKNNHGRTVTGYFGDTNFNSAFYKNSIPSAGGHAKGGKTANPKSSGASEDTNFMQSIPVMDTSGKKHQIKQPSSLNFLDIETTKDRKTATDHPSIMAYTAHTSPIVGRNAEENLDYYRETEILKPKNRKRKFEKMQDEKMAGEAHKEEIAEMIV